VPLTGLSWAAARERLVGGDTYLLTTVRPDARPHVVPVLAVWLDGALHFNTGRTARKARNLADNPHCAITVPVMTSTWSSKVSL
jgi:nitroimidazol reductase NimA-like FMN-containing flavoprotein (pyridoxamine 5'-phosphate oxidase superfamily)